MSTKNKVQLIGHLGKQPEVVVLKNNQKLAKFSLATNESFKDKNGEWQTETTWHNITAWGRTADGVEKYLQKGSFVLVEGRIRNHVYEKNGEKRYSTEIVISNFISLNKSEGKMLESDKIAENSMNTDLPF